MAYWALLFTIIGGIFRRWLGGGYIQKIGKIHRIWKLVVLVIFLVLMYLVCGKFPSFTDWKGWLCMVWAIGWVVRFNNHSHSGMYVLYDDAKFRPKYGWIRWVLNKLFGHRNYYHFSGKFIGLVLGYLVPALLASLTMDYHWFWLAGMVTPIGYALAEGALKKYSCTEYAEYFNGATTFLLFFLNI